MCKLLCSIVLIVFSISATVSFDQTNVGAGTLYTLKVVEDVWLEQSTRNYNSYPWLIVGKHIYYPKKRSLLRFQDIPKDCKSVNQAMMYLYYSYSHKASFVSVNQAPFITRTIQAHRVLKSWKETEATTTNRYSGASWQQAYLGLDNTDADSHPTGKTTVYAGRPSGFVEIDVTLAVKYWSVGKPNYGLLIWATNEDKEGRDTRFFSKSYSDSSKHPYIVINCD